MKVNITEMLTIICCKLGQTRDVKDSCKHFIPSNF